MTQELIRSFACFSILSLNHEKSYVTLSSSINQQHSSHNLTFRQLFVKNHPNLNLKIIYKMVKFSFTSFVATILTVAATTTTAQELPTCVSSHRIASNRIRERKVYLTFKHRLYLVTHSSFFPAFPTSSSSFFTRYHLIH